MNCLITIIRTVSYAFCFVIISVTANAQITISGPNCTTSSNTIESDYSISGEWISSASVEWDIEGGVIINNTANNSTVFSGVISTIGPTLKVIWTNSSGAAQGTVKLYYNGASIPVFLKVNFAPPLVPDLIDGDQKVDYHTIPTTLTSQTNGTNIGSCTLADNYEWFSCSAYGGTYITTGVTTPDYPFSVPLNQTTFFQRKVSNSSGTVSSNIIKVEVVSVNWENMNYVREHNVLTTGVNDWQAVDQLPIGQKLQSTSYLDGFGRTVEKVDREVSTPLNSNTLWGDIVRFSRYDAYGRQPLQYLPYTIQYSTKAGTESGKFKQNAVSDQAYYYSSVYNETNPFSSNVYDNSPLNTVLNTKQSGGAWSASSGNSISYDLNSADENVRILTIGYILGSAPSSLGVYPQNTLIKSIYTDENGKTAIKYFNKAGELILTKTQIDDNPTIGSAGWICVYDVYDDFGLLRYTIQPEAVKYFEGHNWDFTSSDAQTVLNEMCFRYEYDDRGRNIVKKAPGVMALNKIYDIRGRIVFMQDGNQSLLPTPQWIVNLYDDLDRHITSALYNTTETISQLQADINSATTTTNISVTAHSAVIDNIIVDTRNTAISDYKATNSVSFVADAGNNFNSLVGDYYSVTVSPDVEGSTITTTVTTFKNPISPGNWNNPALTTILKYVFYDDYSFAGVKSFDNSFNNSTAYNVGDPNVMPIAISKRTQSLPTGAMVKVLGTNMFLSSTNYYDEKGRLIQTLVDNIKRGQDIVTRQYHWTGRLLSSYDKHSTANSGYSGFGILTKNIFDNIGRVIGIQKTYGTNVAKIIATYDYDDIGRLHIKHLDPGYVGSGKSEMESLTYAYNLHNQIIGINKDYALKTSNASYQYNKWDNFFGMYLGYDNSDHVFNSRQLDGHVTGILWTTQGDDAQRKYDYTYDNSGRLTSALFNEKINSYSDWGNDKMNFSVTGTGTNNTISYDLNGNLLSLIQMGVLPGTSAPVQVDNLVYAYQSYSNKLSSISDIGTSANANGQMGDFKDGANPAGTVDYIYDSNGNIVIDLNKTIGSIGVTNNPGVTYNYLDKPTQVIVAGKGKIDIVYDADGNKLQKSYTPQGSTTSATTTYIQEFVYQETVTGGVSSNLNLSYINFEEGRIRVIQPVSQNNGLDILSINGGFELPNNRQGVYDYYIRDYQDNVRMILTEEKHEGSNVCTMETARDTLESAVFGQSGAANEVEQSRFEVSQIPGQSVGQGWQNNNIGSQVSRLGNIAGHKTGPNVLLKVMAGDEVNAITQYYYQNPVNNGSGTTSLTRDVLSTIVQTILGSNNTSAVVKGASGSISNQLNSSGAFSVMTEPDVSNIIGNNPKAYLTVLFFDERFNLIVDGSSAFRRVAENQAGNSNASPLVLAGIKAPKNGYAFIYVSNESDEPVYFDNLNVGLNRGSIIEEDHYYPFGLKISAISSVKAPDINEGNITNKYLYNDKELIDEADLDWYDYGFRSYDPQIGRFTQLDPLTSRFPELTPFQYASNEPIANSDLDGLEAVIATIETTLADGTMETTRFYSWNMYFMHLKLFGSVVNELQPVVVSNGSLFKTIKSIGTRLAKATARAAEDVGMFTVGTAYAISADNLYVMNEVQGIPGIRTDLQYSFGFGKILGHAIVFVQGAAEIFGGGGGEIFSVGIATPIAVPVVIHGFSVSVSSGYHVVHDQMIIYSTGEGEGGGADNETNEPTKYEESSPKAEPLKNAPPEGDIPLTKSKFGHTFSEHGEEETEYLTKRAEGSKQEQGQFLDNQQAAKFIQEHVSELKNGAKDIPIPEGFKARIINPDGSYSIPTHIRLVPGGKGVKTAYPVRLK